MNAPAESTMLRMTLDSDLLPVFYPHLQQGVWLPATIGCSVMALLSGQLGIAESYVIDRITTLFLDGKTIDDPKSSFLKDGSTLALSSAMPGLVGATMRRGGHLAAMRGEITYHQGQSESIRPGRIRIKLFNLVMKELAARFLEHGVFLPSSELAGLFREHAGGFRGGCHQALLDGQPLACDGLSAALDAKEAHQDILLQITWKA